MDCSIHSAPYRAGKMAREFKKQEIERMLTVDNELAQTELESPSLLGPKKDGPPPFYVYYQYQIALSIWDSHSVLSMDESIDSLGDAAIFSTMQANSRYGNVEIGEKVPRQVVIHLSPQPMWLPRNVICTKERPRDVSTRYRRPPGDDNMAGCPGSSRRYRIIFGNTKRQD